MYHDCSKGVLGFGRHPQVDISGTALFFLALLHHLHFSWLGDCCLLESPSISDTAGCVHEHSLRCCSTVLLSGCVVFPPLLQFPFSITHLVLRDMFSYLASWALQSSSQSVSLNFTSMVLNDWVIYSKVTEWESKPLINLRTSWCHRRSFMSGVSDRLLI